MTQAPKLTVSQIELLLNALQRPNRQLFTIEAKIIEVRDSGTRIDCLAFRMKGSTPVERHYIHGHAGYPEDGSSIMLMRLSDGKATSDLYEWSALGMGSCTMQNAHHFIEQHFDELADGEVVDVEYIRGETKSPKKPERLARAVQE